MSRGKWQDMVKGVLDAVTSSSKQEKPKQESKKLSIEDVPGDPGSTVGTIREYKKKQRELADM